MEYDMRIAMLNPRLYHCKEFLADFRDHDQGRLSKAGLFVDPSLMRELPRAYGIIYRHARQCGASLKDQSMRSFITKLGWLSHRCFELGLEKEAQELLALIRDAGGDERNYGRRIWRSEGIVLSKLHFLSTETRFAIDTLNDRIIVQQTQPIMMPPGQKYLVVTGWAVDQSAANLAGGVYVKIDAKLYEAYYGSDRQDVADHFGTPQYRYSGFEAVIPGIEEGRHSLSLVILSHDDKGYYLPAQSIDFEITTANLLDDPIG
jgi:hypothetical protein